MKNHKKILHTNRPEIFLNCVKSIIPRKDHSQVTTENDLN